MAEYLEILRKSNELNMYEAGPYIKERYDLTDKEARECLSYWFRGYIRTQ